MQFDWDETKRLRVLRERGLDFADAGLFFDGRPVVTEYSPRGDESRWRSTAEIEGRIVTAVWMQRDDRIRIVTMRRAHAREEKQYRQLYI